MFVIGLTGGIACGKSRAARYLAARGAHHIDADALGHRAYEPGGPAYDEVVAAFGAEVVGAQGFIDRKVLGPLVFGDAKALAQLNAIMRPAIGALLQKELQSIAIAQPDAIVVLEAALLLEGGWARAANEIWLVCAPPELALQRALARGGITEEQFHARVRAQMPDEQRRTRADIIIENTGSEAQLESRLDQLWRALQTRLR